MAYSRRIRGRAPSTDYWPGFVDAMATLLLVLIFLLVVFMLTQFFQGQALAEKESALNRLHSQISELADLLALSKAEKLKLQTQVGSLSSALHDLESEKSNLQTQLSDRNDTQMAALNAELQMERQISAEALAQVELVNQHLTVLRRQLDTIEAALEESEAKDQESQTQIADLGRRLNSALARKVQELARYRSEFFSKLRTILDARDDIEIVGDRFVFQSEIFFHSGSATINPSGKGDLNEISKAVKEISRDIPDDINWILRIDGHSDAAPINTPEFPTNWHLSSARAIAVVQYLITQGVPEKRLVAAGFGEFQPLTNGQTPTAYRRNRRIEFKLTQR